MVLQVLNLGGAMLRRSVTLHLGGRRWSSNVASRASAALPSHWPVPLQSHVGGEFVASATPSETLEVPDAALGEPLVACEVAGDAEIERAISAARAAQPAWGALSGTERGRILRRAATILEERNDELALLEAWDTGRPLQETLYVDILSARDCLEWFGCLAPSVAGEHRQLPGGSHGYTRREPLGVTAGIGAWNYPIQGAAWKAAPSLACGNAMIFKPAEDTPLTALALAEVLREAGLPDGLFSVVLGAASTGQRLTRHPDIAKISFTGEVGTGRSICADAAATLKQVTMELGGKSPLIVFADADLDEAVSAAMLANWYSCGEVCSNGTRIFVQESVRAAFLERFAARTAKLSVGDPLDVETQVGALINSAHLDKVQDYVAKGVAEGADLVLGGERVSPPGPCERGAFMRPAIFDACTDDMTIVREEIFGPVAAVLGFKDEDEVVERANASIFGLSAGVFTSDVRRAHRMVARLEAGTTWINNYNLAPVELPWGGHKQSGLGRENGTAAIEHWTQLKSVYVEMGKIDCPYE